MEGLSGFVSTNIFSPVYMVFSISMYSPSPFVTLGFVMLSPPSATRKSNKMSAGLSPSYSIKPPVPVSANFMGNASGNVSPPISAFIFRLLGSYESQSGLGHVNTTSKAFAIAYLSLSMLYITGFSDTTASIVYLPSLSSYIILPLPSLGFSTFAMYFCFLRSSSSVS